MQLQALEVAVNKWIGLNLIHMFKLKYGGLMILNL